MNIIYEFSIKSQTNGCFALVIKKRRPHNSRLESNVKRICGYKSISAAEVDQPRYEANITPGRCYRDVMDRAVLLVELHKDRHRYSRI